MSAATATPPGGAAPEPTARAVVGRSLVLAVLLAWTAVAVVLASASFASYMVAGQDPVAWRVLGQGFLQAYAWILPTLAAFELTRRFPLERGRLLRNGTAHAALAVPVVVAKMVVYHFPGVALKLLDASVSFPLALSAFGGESLLTYGLIVGVAHAVAYARNLRERELARSQLEVKLVQAQLQALKMQLHPHFLFNTLHAVSTLVHADPDRAERVIASLSELLRTTLALQQTQEVPLREELAALEPYLDIEKTRLGERLTVELRVDPAAADVPVPHLLLQPLVENAIRHGIAPRRRPGWVEVAASRVDGELRLVVADNGCGFSGPPRPDAVGLANTRARLQQLYGAAHAFRVESAPEEGTRVEITIPVRPLESGNGAAPEEGR